jgi:hypothetical protein
MGVTFLKDRGSYGTTTYIVVLAALWRLYTVIRPLPDTGTGRGIAVTTLVIQRVFTGGAELERTHNHP